ncbi:MAG: response regulator [Azonexus sp.]|jgi:PleD family two-component response regulator|uniref:response regulator n=1 Tax=Azonexus sp. TaxID=1872668 RepID=UPI002827DD93|nr:response regulator [Azonexus sp.]MDR0776392.1 response regulator [Azonexus sp.]
MNESHKDNGYFDLSVLLQQNDLNIRRLAEIQPSLTVDEYSESLREFLAQSPDTSSALRKVASAEADDMRYWRSIEAMITLMKRLECETCVDALFAISHARGKGDWRAAAFHATKMLEDFNGLHSRIMAAKKTGSADVRPDGATTLKEYVAHLNDEAAEIKMPQAAPSVAAEKAVHKPLILAVDDSLDILAALEFVLRDKFRVHKLPRPTLLKNVLQQVTPDLFLLDYKMPELSGFDLVPVIRSFEKHKYTPIIFLTSEGTASNVSTAIALGASDFVVKPIDPDALRQKIAKYIRA